MSFFFFKIRSILQALRRRLRFTHAYAQFARFARFWILTGVVVFSLKVILKRFLFWSLAQRITNFMRTVVCGFLELTSVKLNGIRVHTNGASNWVGHDFVVQNEVAVDRFLHVFVDQCELT